MVKKRYLAITAVIGVAITYLLICGFSFIKTGFGLFDSHENEYGKFVRVGDMHYARSGHKAVLLQDGRVLIVGGASEPVAEIYDPEKRKFYKTGSMIIDRDYYDNYTATLLSNGKVLITGGSKRNKSLKNTELFNPKTGNFEKGPELNLPRAYHTANKLPDGKVLISGGFYKEKITQAELYDPKINEFKLIGEMIYPRSQHSAILTSKGVFFIGGYTNSSIIEKLNKNINSEIFDIDNKKFIDIDKYEKYQRIKPNLIKLNNKVLISDGIINQSKRGIVEIYDPISNKIFKMEEIRQFVGDGHSASLLKDGRVLFLGGAKMGLMMKSLDNSALYDPLRGKFYKGEKMIFSRSNHKTMVLKNGNVLITGGITNGWSNRKATDKAEMYILNKE